ncbi:enolase C-terminal domain-like protein [Roseixanthobacter liquoris]|uniref:enolase C-terminal domain-like protein n=1 Tax=Roseixanthobacter liquoris TaxID=3119921 RepID=UPI003726DC42
MPKSMSTSAPRIVRVTARAVNAPLSRPLRTASGTMESAPLVLVDLETDAGLTGHAYAFAYTPVLLGALTQATRDVGRLLEGREVLPQVLTEALRARFRLAGTPGLLDMALASLDIAAWDAHAKSAGLPLVRLLGGRATDLPAYASFGMDGADDLSRACAAAAQQGFGAVKIKIGYPTFAEDLAVVRAVKRAIGAEVALLIDYNQSLAVPDAVHRCGLLDAEGLGWIEEPTRYDNTAGHARIAAETKTALQLGENLWGPGAIAESIAAGASDLMMPDLIKVGGVSGWLAASAICQAARMPVSNHFFQEASAHLMAVTPTAHFVEYFDLAGPVLRTPLLPKDGTVRASDEPGLGIAWNEEAVARYAV